MKNKECVVSLLAARSLSRSFHREQSWNFLHHAHVNPSEFNTRLNVRERYADLRRQFITHFKADDAENARGGCIEGGNSSVSRASRTEADYRARSCYFDLHPTTFDRFPEEIVFLMIGVRNGEKKKKHDIKRKEFVVVWKRMNRANDIAVNRRFEIS